MNVSRAGLVVALPEECRSLSPRRVQRGDCFPLDDARLVCIAGMGRDNARQAAQRLVEAGARALVSWGCAAALSPLLKAGDLCLPAEIIDADTGRWVASAAWQRRVREALEHACAVCGEPLLSADRLAASVADKRVLAAASGAVAVDMESAAVAAVASARDLPFLAVRAIADPADMALPGAVVRTTDDTGALSRSALIGELLRHPREIAGVLRLAAQFRAALQTLTRAADRLGADLLLDAGAV